MKLRRFEIHEQGRVGILQDKFVLDLTGLHPGIFSNVHTILAQAKEKNLSLQALIEKYVKDAHRTHSLLMEVFRSDE